MPFSSGVSQSITNPTQSSSSSGEAYSPQGQSLFPYLKGRLYGQDPRQQMGQSAWDAAFGQAGGRVGAYPKVTTAPIWDPGQIQQQVNLRNATSDQQLGGRQRQIAEQTAGRGFGANSPLAQALSQNAWGQNLAQKTAGENELRWGAAQGNAKQVLAEQQADVERSRAMGQEDVQRRNLGVNLYQTNLSGALQNQNMLLGALQNYLRPLQSSRSQSHGGGGSSASAQSSGSMGPFSINPFYDPDWGS